MEQFTINAYESETASQFARTRMTELIEQHWNRDKSQSLALNEGIDFTDAHWAVIVFLRKYYLFHGLPINARTLAMALNNHFARLGGNKYLHELFAGGPVTQGCRLGNLRTPAYAADMSFGTCF